MEMGKELEEEAKAYFLVFSRELSDGRRQKGGDF